jgi:tryptophan synthase beta chain
VSLPLELVRQSIRPVEFWDIPPEVICAYQRFRPTPLWRARSFEAAVGARVPIWVKYEGGNISGSHKLNTALAQAYFYRKAGVSRLVAGTGAGQWGTALAAACAMFGLDCTVFMVGSSLRRKPYRGVLMRMLGAEVHASPSGLTDLSRSGHAQGNSLSLAIGEAAEHASRTDGAAFCTGSGETYSILHQSVIGIEAAQQLSALGATADVVTGCFGAGSNFGGIALPFFATARTAGIPPPLLVAAESASSPKLTRGVYAFDHTDAAGTAPLEPMYTIGSSYPIPDSHSAGLRYHGAAKLISAMRHAGQVAATAVRQPQALEAGRTFARTEAVLPAPESGHALAAAAALAGHGAADPARRGRELKACQGVLVCVSGHGYLDLGAYQEFLEGTLSDAEPALSALATATADLARVSDDATDR